MGLSDSSYQLFRKLRWPDVGPVPCFVKPSPAGRCGARTGRSASTAWCPPITLPFVKIVARKPPAAR
jgi:hypothetical protein